MKKHKKDDMMTQSAVRLPQGLHQRLKKAGGERGMGEEIRRRLEASFAAEAEAPSNPKTRELLEEIERLALTTPLDAPWYADGDAFKVFKGAIDAALSKVPAKRQSRRPHGQTSSDVRQGCNARGCWPNIDGCHRHFSLARSGTIGTGTCACG